MNDNAPITLVEDDAHGGGWMIFYGKPSKYAPDWACDMLNALILVDSHMQRVDPGHYLFDDIEEFWMANHDEHGNVRDEQHTR